MTSNNLSLKMSVQGSLFRQTKRQNSKRRAKKVKISLRIREGGMKRPLEWSWLDIQVERFLISIILIKTHMNDKRQNILTIQYHLQKGLTFSWNLRGLSNKDVYFRHLFVLASSQQTLLENTLTNICAKIKIGDFLALCHKKKDQNYENLRWTERTSLNFDNISLKGIEKFATNELISLLPVIAKETQEFSNPLILNIFLQDPSQLPKYKEALQKLRVQGFFLYHVNFFGDFACHDISPATGFNEINTSEDTQAEVARIYRSLAFQTAALRVKVELGCPNIQLAPRRDCLWETVDFGRMKRFYYGPSIHYEHDWISFLDESASRAGTNVPMMVALEVTLFSGKVLVAQKSFTLTTENMRLYEMTRCDSNAPRSTYEFSNNVRSKTQPFCSSSSLALTKIITGE